MQNLRTAIAERLRNPAPYPHDSFADRGIVTCAGGRRYFVCAWVLIWILRRAHQSKLPIQLWHLGRGEMSDAMRSLLEEQDVEVVDAETVLPRSSQGRRRMAAQTLRHRPQPVSRGALPRCRHRSVGHSGYHLRLGYLPPFGILLWPDIIDLREGNPIWTISILRRGTAPASNSSVIAIDKERAWNALDLTILLNEHWREVYQFLHGDKDTFLLACIDHGG